MPDGAFFICKLLYIEHNECFVIGHEVAVVFLQTCLVECVRRKHDLHFNNTSIMRCDLEADFVTVEKRRKVVYLFL